MRTRVAMTALTAGGLGLSLCAQLFAAYLFGASGAMDAYFAGVALPMALVLLANEVASLVVVPRLHRALREHGRGALARLQARLLMASAAFWAAVSAAGIAGSEAVIAALFAGFDTVGAQAAASVLAIQFLAVPLSTSASLLLQFRFLEQDYPVPYATVLAAPIFVIALAAAFHDALGPSSLAFGSVAGAAATCLALLALTRAWRLPCRIALRERIPAARLKSVLPVLLAVLPVHAVSLLDRHFAAAMTEGSLTALSYSWIFAMAAVAVVFRGWSMPVFHAMAGDAAEDAAGGARQASERATRFRERMLKSTRELLLLAGAMLVALQVAGPAVIGWLLSRGSFDAAAAGLVETAFRYHSGAVPGVVVFMLFVRACCAAERLRPAAAIGTLGLLAYAALASALQSGGAAGLAQASVATWSAMGLCALVYMRRAAWLPRRPSEAWAR